LKELNLKKICRKCGEDKELNAELWHRNRSSKTGYAAICKVCNNKENQGKRIPAGLIVPEKDLSFQGIPKLEIKMNRKYKFIVPGDGNRRNEKFEGEVIQIQDRHITFRHKLGFAETFLKWDLSQYQIKEV